MFVHPLVDVRELFFQWVLNAFHLSEFASEGKICNRWLIAEHELAASVRLEPNPLNLLKRSIDDLPRFID